jgi:hypothetical protein
MATVIVVFWTIRRIAGIAMMPIAIAGAVVANVYGAMGDRRRDGVVGKYFR